MPFLLHRAAETQQLVRNRLVGGLEHVDQGARLCFVVLGEESYGQAYGACAASSVDCEGSLDVVRLEREKRGEWWFMKWEL